jgi:hypothetical protein
MRALRLLFLALGLIVGLPLGCFLLYWTLELDAVVQKTQETPQQLPAAQLAHKGVPDNLYVELTDFTFGKPVIEEGQHGWYCVWLPVEPNPSSAKPAKYTLFFRADAHDPASLDSFLKRAPNEALVTTGLPPSSQWRIPVGPCLRKAYPKLISDSTLLLSEPRVSVLGHPVALADPRLHDPAYASMAAWGGGSLVFFGLFCIYAMMKGRQGESDGACDARGCDFTSLRAQLESERPDSTHVAKTWGVVQKMLGYGLLSALLILVVVLMGGAAVASQAEGKPLGAVLFVFAGLPLLLGARAAVRALWRTFHWPTDIAVCPTGLRWRQGSTQRLILWAEVADVEREVKVIPRVHQGGLVGAIQALNDRSPPQFSDRLRITLYSGESYVMTAQLVTDYMKLVDTAPRLWKEGAMGHETASITNAWRKALPLRARSLRF